jgi:hypothetical protein
MVLLSCYATRESDAWQSAQMLACKLPFFAQPSSGWGAIFSTTQRKPVFGDYHVPAGPISGGNRATNLRTALLATCF